MGVYLVVNASVDITICVKSSYQFTSSDLLVVVKYDQFNYMVYLRKYLVGLEGKCISWVSRSKTFNAESRNAHVLNIRIFLVQSRRCKIENNLETNLHYAAFYTN